jgi:Glyoxalase-like domain
MKVDHVVLNAKTELDALQRGLCGLGFNLSPRGRHSLGSENHVAAFRSGYLELIGVPPERPDVRPEIGRGNAGIDGLVFQTQDAEATRDSLRQSGYHATEVREFSRPVDLGNGTGSARFRTTRLDPTPFPWGRVYFCEHLTPELVWRDGAMDHANGSRGIAEVVAVSARPHEQARLFAGLAGSDAEVDQGTLSVRFEDCLVRVVSPESYLHAYGTSALTGGGRTEFFGAVVIRCENVAFFDEVVPPDRWRKAPGPGRSVRLLSNERHILLEFKELGEGLGRNEPR